MSQMTSKNGKNTTLRWRMRIHFSIRTTPLYLVLLRPPPTFGAEGLQPESSSSTSCSKQYYPTILEASMSGAKSRMLKTRERYKRDFDKKFNTFPNKNPRTGDLVFSDVSGGESHVEKARK